MDTPDRPEEPESEPGSTQAPDDTAAFRRFYRGEAPATGGQAPNQGLFDRLRALFKKS